MSIVVHGSAAVKASWARILARQSHSATLAARARRFAVNTVAASTQTELDLVLEDDFVQRMAVKAIERSAAKAVSSTSHQPDDVMEALFLYHEMQR